MHPDRKSPAQPGRQPAPPSLSRPFVASSAPAEGVDVLVQPTKEELQSLARENDLVAVDGLEARLHVAPSGKDGLKVVGRLRVQIRQTCVVTLEEFPSTIDQHIHVRFVPPPAGALGKTVNPPEITLDSALDVDADAPDPLVGGIVDLGAVVSEFLTLALDPYPRRPGAQFTEPAPETAEDGPFAALLRGRKTASDGDGD